jgi:ABC-2 type transport system permease protein
MVLLRKYRGVLLATVQTSLAYPVEAFARCGFMLILIFVFVQLWSVTFRTSGVSSVGGYDLPRMIWYLVLTETIVLSCPRLFDKIDTEVKGGELAYTLSRPYDYPLFHFAQYLGHVALVLPANFAIGAVLALALAGTPHLAPALWPVVALAVLLAICLNFLIELTIGLFAFWFEDTYAFFWIYQKLTFTLGGLFLPLSLFPSLLRRFAGWLPFSAIAYAPARLVAGFDAATAAGTLLTQAIWLFVLGGLVMLIYRGGIRRLNINGG